MGEWPHKRIEDVALRVGMGPFGSSIKVDTFVAAGVPVISGEHLRKTRLEEQKFNFITVEHADKLKNSNVFQGDVIFTHAGSIGQCAYIPSNSQYSRYILSQRQFFLRCDTDQILPQFVTYFFKSHQGQHLLLANASQTGVPSIARPSSYLKTIEIPVPPLPEQREIASILGALDDKIELNRRMNATLEAMARALFQSWFVDFDPVRAKAEGRQPVGMDAETAALFPDSFEDSALGPIPKGWAVMALGEVCDLEYGKPLKAEDRRGGDIPVFGAGGQVGWHNEALATGPGIVVGRKGNPGAVTWSQSDFFAIDTAFFAKSKHPALSPYILFQILSNLDLSRLSVDSGVPGLNRHHAYMSLLVVAATPILQAFNTHAQTLGAEFASNDNSSRSLVGLRNLLIPKLLSGELRVGDVAA